MPTFARAQFIAGDDGVDPATRAITPSAATSLLIAVMSERSGVGHTPHTMSDGGATGGDWVKAFGWDQALGDSNARHSFSLWWKVAGSTAAITVSGDDGTGNGKHLSLHEYTTDTPGTWSVVSGAAVGADTGTGSSSPLAIGPTGSAAAGDNLVLLSINWRTGSDQAYPGAATGGFTGLTTTGSGSNGRQHGTAWQQDAAGGTFSTSVDWTGSGHESAGGIVVFNLGSGATTHDLAADAVATAAATAALTAESTTKELAAAAAAVASATAALTAGAAGEIAITALLFPGKYSSDANARFKLTGASLPNRFAFTEMGIVNFNQHSSYYGMAAFFDDLGAGAGSWSGGHYEYLSTPYATTSGAVDAEGLYTSTDGGPVHHWEMGGVTPFGSSNSQDRGASAGGSAILVRKGVWLKWYRICQIVNIAGTDYAEHIFWPDLEGSPAFSIVSRKPLADYPTPTNPALAIGSYKWAVQTATSNDEPLDGYIRGYRVVKGVLTHAQALLELADAERGTGSWATTEATTFGGYILDNPTVANVTTAGFTWDNADRPADYSGTIIVAEPVALAADAAAQAGATASLLKGVSLSGAGLAVAGGSASMSHVVPLAASAVAVAVAGGQMALAVQLSAGALSTAAASAGLALAVPLSADGAAQAGASADLSTNASVDLAADAQASASSSAVLSLTISLSADAVNTALASAALAKSVSLDADGAAQADGAASLQVGAGTDLSADAITQASAGASLWLDVPLGADALAQAVAGGSLSLAVLLGADALAQAGGSAALAGAVQLSAGGQVVATATGSLQVLGALAQYQRALRITPPRMIWTARPQQRIWRATAS
jgi:hypothetical protein